MYQSILFRNFAMRLTSMLCARMQLARIPSARTICASLASLVCLAGNVQGQCNEASQGFYLPSLQTLIMMPLSQAGDRLEAHWASHWHSSKSTSIGVPSVQCDVLDEPLRWAQASGVRPSYELQDRSIPGNLLTGNLLTGNLLTGSGPLDAVRTGSDTGALDSGALDSGYRAEVPDDKDEQFAEDLNEPVRFKRPASKSETLAVLALEPVSNPGKQPEESSASAVRFASGRSTVRATGGSDSRAGEIRDRHQQRKRAENFGQKPHRVNAAGLLANPD
jgi:hypothetical protein